MVPLFVDQTRGMRLVCPESRSAVFRFFTESRGIQAKRQAGRESERGKKLCVVPAAAADPFGDLDFAVEALRLARASQMHKSCTPALTNHVCQRTESL